MPDPNKFKSKEAFMKACIAEVRKEGKTTEQAVGKCLGMWNNKKKGGKK